MNHFYKIFSVVLLFTILNSPGKSCNVPVFRYALERWPADPFEVIVVHHGELSQPERAVVNWLEQNSYRHKPYANFFVRIVEKSVLDSLDTDLMSIPDDSLPSMAIRFPRTRFMRKYFWAGPLTGEIARAVIDSPLRRDIAGKILGGDAAVWVLLESGNKKKDDAAAAKLVSALKKMEETLELPELLGTTAEDEPEKQISFSMLKLSRTDSTEFFLREMLMHIEPDLGEYTAWPMAFPVYGRGRALFTLVGEGINEENIEDTCAFLTGECSCEVKAFNPGIDLLMVVDWVSGLEESWIDITELPPLVGISELARSAYNDTIVQAAETENKTTVSSEGDVISFKGKSRLLRNILFSLGTIIIIIIVMSFTVKKRG